MTTNQSNRKSLTGLVEGATASSNLDITGNVNMKGFKLFNLGLGTDLQDSTNKTQLDAVVSDISIIDNSISIIEISLNNLDNHDASFQAIDASLQFLDLSGVQFSLGVNKLDISVNKLEISANKYELFEASINFLEASGAVFALGINKLDVSVNKLEISANKYELYENSLNFLEASGAVFALDIGTIESSCNVYEASINAIDTTNFINKDGSVHMAADLNMGDFEIVNLKEGLASSDAVNYGQLFPVRVDVVNISAELIIIENSLNFLEASGVEFSLDIGTIETSCNIYEASINALEAEGTQLWTGTSDICYNSGNVGIGTADPDAHNGGGGLEIKYKGSVLPTDQEYIPLTLAYHQTNYHATTFPRYRFRLDSISNSTGFGNGLFSIESKNSTNNNYLQVFSLTQAGQLLINKTSPRDSPVNGNFCIQSDNGSSPSLGYNNMGEFRNLTYSQIFQMYWTAIRFFQISTPQQNGDGFTNFAMGIEAVNNANGKGQLMLNPYGGSVAVGYPNYLNTSRKLLVNGTVFAAGQYQGSDDRIKYNETPIGSALPIINKLKTLKYEKITSSKKHNGIWIPSDASWNEVKNDVDLSGNRLYEYNEEIGYIAQDIRNEIPDLSFCVSGQEEDASGNQTLLAVNYNNIFCLVVQAVQELDAKRRDDNKKFIDLNKRMIILEEKLKNIEAEGEKEYIL